MCLGCPVRSNFRPKNRGLARLRVNAIDDDMHMLVRLVGVFENEGLMLLESEGQKAAAGGFEFVPTNF